MKAAICLVSLAILAGVVTAAPSSSNPSAWESNTLYTYQVRSRFAAGILGLESPTVSQFETVRALVELTWQANVYLVPGKQNELLISPRDFKAVIAKEKIHPREGSISSKENVDIPQKARNVLEKVMIVRMDPKSGVPESISVRSNEELTPSEKNIKRAQMQAFILNPGTSDLVVKGNLNRQTNSVRPSEQDDDSGFFYKTMEESIHGECETYYTVSQTGPLQSLYQLQAQDIPARGQRNSQENAQQQQQQQYQSSNSRSSQQHRRQSSENSISSEEVQQQPWPLAYKELCGDQDQVYIIRKTLNLTACKDRPVLSNMMPAELLNCRPGDNSCGSLWNHVVSTRFLACGTSREQFTIMEVNQEERFVYGIRTEEKLDAFVVKNVTLVKKERISANAAADRMKTQGSQVYTIHSLVFQFDLKNQQQQFNGQQQQQHQWQRQSQSQRRQATSGSDSNSESKEQLHGNIKFPLQNQQPGLESPELLPQLITTVVSKEQLQERSLVLLNLAVNSISDPKKSIADEETIFIQCGLAKNLRYMDKDQQLRLFEAIDQKYNHEEEPAHDIYFDALVGSGTNPSIVVLFNLIEGGKISPAKASLHIMALRPHTPTKPFLQRFLQFLETDVVQRNALLRRASYLKYSNILHKTCMNARIKQSSYSFALYGPFCEPKDVKPFVQKVISKLSQVLKTSSNDFMEQKGHSKAQEISLQLTILSNIGDPAMIETVQQILDRSNNSQLKAKAIFSLSRLIRSHEENNPPQTSSGRVDTQQNRNEVDRVEIDPLTDNVVERKVLPLLMSVAFDKSEHPIVRCAAIQMLLYCTFSDETVYQHLAISTWTENSPNVHNFIYTSIKNLAKLQGRGPTPMHAKMIIKARSVSLLLKPVDEINLSRSTNSFSSENVPDLDVAYFRQLSWYSSVDSNLPTSFYFRNFITFGSGAVGTNPIEFSAHFRTLSRVYDIVAEKFGSSSSEESGEQNQQMQKKIVKREMKEASSVEIYAKIRDGMQMLWQMEKIENYFTSRTVADFKARLSHPYQINYQKKIDLAYQSLTVPSILGFEITAKMRLPISTSLRGKVVLNGGHQFHAQLDAVAEYMKHSKISMKMPLLRRKAESGLVTHFVVQLPLRITVQTKSDNPVAVAITPTPDINGTVPNGKIQLVVFHRKPYVVVQKDELYPSLLNKDGEMTIIRTVQPETTSETHQGDVLGFSVTTQEFSDYRREKESPSGWIRYLKRFPSAESFLNFGTFGGKVAKYAKRQVILNIDESRTKTLVVLVAAKRGSGSLAEGFDTDVSSSSSSSSSSSESQESDSSNSSDESNARRSQSSSSSSSSSESNSASNSDEDSKEQLQKGRVIAVALLAKPEPIPPVGHPAVINLLRSDSVNLKQFIIQFSIRTDKGYVQYAQGNPADAAAQSLLAVGSNSVSALAKAVIEPRYQGQQLEFCSVVSAKIVYPNNVDPRKLIALRTGLLNQDLKVPVKARLTFGESCKNTDLQRNFISIAGDLVRGQNMTEWARYKSPEAKQCQRDENNGFAVSDDCLTVAIQQAGALNRAQLTVLWSENLPLPVQKAAYFAQDIVKAIYMDNTYHNRFPQTRASRNSASVELTLTPDTKYWKAMVLTNATQMTIRNVPSHPLIQAAFPLSVIQPIGQNILDALLGSDSQPTCQLQSTYISSFDNVVGQIDPSVAQGCYHVLTADLSGQRTMAAFVKNVGTDNLKMLLVLSQNNITLATQRGVQRSQLTQVESANDIAVLVNGKPVALPYTLRKAEQRSESNDYVARIQPHPMGGVQVLTPTNDFAFDGQRIVIFGDDVYRNSTAGICGDFNGQRVGDHRSKKDIPLSNPTLLYADYAWDPEGKHECNVVPQVLTQIKQEESLAQIRGHGNQRWGAPFFRAQQRSAWLNRPTQAHSYSSSSFEESRRQQRPTAAWN